MTEEELMKEDLYALFDIPPDADENTIRKAYRKSALKYHPDKNPDDKKASDKFNKLSVALTILGDKDKRIKYDIKRANKNRQQARLNEMDKARRAAREHMDMREKFGAEYFRRKASEMEKEQQMREEGKRVLEEEMRLMREEILKEKEQRAKEIEKQRRRHQEYFRLKIKYWREIFKITSKKVFLSFWNHWLCRFMAGLGLQNRLCADSLISFVEKTIQNGQ